MGSTWADIIREEGCPLGEDEARLGIRTTISPLGLRVVRVAGVVGGACSFSIASGAGSNACAVLGSNGMLLGPQKLWPARARGCRPARSAASRAPGPPVVGGLSEH